MASGRTETGSLADSLETTISAARIVRERVGVMTQHVDKVTLGKGIGLSWNEPALAQLTAQAVGESDKLDNPQELSDTLFTITPTVVGIHTFITDRVQVRITPKSFAKLGELAQNAIERKKGQDAVTVLDGATTSLCGTGTTFASGYITAAAARIKANTSESGPDPMVAMLHDYQAKDISDEIVGGVGTYPVPNGMTEETWRNGFQGKVGNVMVYVDQHITPDSTPDVKGGVYALQGIVMVQGRSPWKETRREPDIGGGGNSVWVYDEYAFGERSAGNWLIELLSDATSPTS